VGAGGCPQDKDRWNLICGYYCWKDDEKTSKKNLEEENLPPNTHMKLVLISAASSLFVPFSYIFYVIDFMSCVLL
jgi:hypothetical protein